MSTRKNDHAARYPLKKRNLKKENKKKTQATQPKQPPSKTPTNPEKIKQQKRTTTLTEDKNKTN